MSLARIEHASWQVGDTSDKLINDHKGHDAPGPERLDVGPDYVVLHKVFYCVGKNCGGRDE